nr:hypothetical protein CFP56_00072 [Quercus suber]
MKSPTPMEVQSTLPSTSRAYCKHIQFGTLKPMHTSCFNPQDDDRVAEELAGDEEDWTFVTYKRLRKQCNLKPHVPYKKRELRASDSKVAPKGKGTNGLKKQRKGARPNEGPLSVTLHEFFPKGFLIEGLMTTTYMVSCHDVDDQENLTGKEEKVNLEETKGTKEEESETHASEETVAISAESHFAYAKFYFDYDTTYDVPQEESIEKKKAKRKEGGKPFTEGPKPNSEVRKKFREEKKEAPTVLRYVPTSKRKEGQSLFELTMETKDKCKKSIQEEDIAILKSDFTLPLPKLGQVASTKPPTQRFH